MNIQPNTIEETVYKDLVMVFFWHSIRESNR